MIQVIKIVLGPTLDLESTATLEIRRTCYVLGKIQLMIMMMHIVMSLNTTITMTFVHRCMNTPSLCCRPMIIVISSRVKGTSV
jgi:hypothetical protein